MKTVAILMWLIGSFTGQQQPPQPMQAAVGTLIIDAELPVGTKRGDYFEAGWLFIDGRLIGRLPVKRSLTLRWGPHDIRVVIGAYSDQKPRYYVVGWPRYFMNRGATETVEVGPVLERSLNGEGTPAGVEARAPDPASASLSDLGQIEEVVTQLMQTPPPRSVVMIPVSAALAGPREFDADQLRFLSRVLRTHLEAPHAPRVNVIVRDLIAILEKRR